MSKTSAPTSKRKQQPSKTPSATKQVSVILETDLLYAIKEVALNRKKAGVEPNTVTGIIRLAIQEIVDKELPH